MGAWIPQGEVAVLGASPMAKYMEYPARAKVI